jgi:hypothetical protein
MMVLALLVPVIVEHVHLMGLTFNVYHAQMAKSSTPATA